jgi:hypothetical protein
MCLPLAKRVQENLHMQLEMGMFQ